MLAQPLPINNKIWHLILKNKELSILNTLELEKIIATTLYLMTRHSKAPKANLEQSIVEHLQMLTNHPECKSQELKDVCKRLLITWKQEARIKELGLDQTSSLNQSIKTNSYH